MVLVLFHVWAQCSFHAGARPVRAGTMRGGSGLAISIVGCGAGYPHLVRGGCGSTAMATGWVRVRNFSLRRALLATAWTCHSTVFPLLTLQVHVCLYMFYVLFFVWSGNCHLPRPDLGLQPLLA